MDAPSSLLHDSLDYFEVLLLAKGGGFAGGTAGHDARGALFDVPLHELLNAGVVHLTVRTRQRRDTLSLV